MLARAPFGAKRFKQIVEVCWEGLVEECELREEECEWGQVVRADSMASHPTVKVQPRLEAR